MTFKTLQFCTEALKTPYPYKWEVFRDDAGIANFLAANSRPINIEIAEIPLDMNEMGHIVVFSDVSKNWMAGPTPFAMSGEGDEFRILSTVLKAVSEYVIKFYDSIDILTFSGEKSPSHKRKGPSGRERVYERLFKKYTPPGGNWKKEIKRKGHETIFTYRKI